MSTFDWRVVARFWSKVSVGRDGVCWEWTAYRRPAGYGQFYVPSPSGLVPIGAHRFAFMLATDAEIPEGINICHRCDNPPCCNPGHLFAGPQEENVQDAWTKGRLPPPPVRLGEDHHYRARPETIPRGAKRPAAYLTEEDVIEILKKRAAGATTVALMKEFGTARSTMQFICSGRSWTHVHGLPGVPPQEQLDAISRAEMQKGKLTPDQVAEIRRELAAGTMGRVLAERFGVSRGQISHIKNEQSWTP